MNSVESQANLDLCARITQLEEALERQKASAHHWQRKANNLSSELKRRSANSWTRYIAQLEGENRTLRKKLTRWREVVCVWAKELNE